MDAVIRRITDGIGTVFLGKSHQIQLVLACLMAKGHLLLEDLPGMGKTTLSQTLAKVLGLKTTRVQFTSDLLPGDILGFTIYDQKNSEFQFRAGPVFTQLLLADEINRATPKTQGALLEAMEEKQVTIDGVSHPLPKPFFVIATQNPVSQMGTYPLPESQLDRFLMKVSLGYPDPLIEKELILGVDRRSLIHSLDPVIDASELLKLQLLARQVHLSDSVVSYIQRLVHASRTRPGFNYGLSPRGTLAIVRASQAWALIQGRSHIVPEDVQAILPSVVEHRVRGSLDHAGHEGVSLVQTLLHEVDVIGR
ncbi:MAG: MoxR family ATPase [Pseudomonadota bacterium]